MPNRLADASSPYLRQHADNPIDWYPWGEEAFAKARVEDKPVLLSVGYSACHWCHVMAHDSFEDPDIARLLNDSFVSIKVDREERPDVDEAYMTAVQLSSGRGGWPMTLFLTPDKKPFFAGTYFPREDRAGHPGFMSIVKGIAEGWKTSRSEFVAAADEFAGALREAVARPAPAGSLDSTALIRNALGALAHDYDRHFGGFGGAPKFPPHTAIEFLLALGTSELLSEEERRQALEMADGTLLTMATGGLRDHVGGGFHRYSTDAHWALPHFEKMLVDNALMLANYATAARVLDRPAYKHVADEIVAWLEREMTSPEGLFYTALDADSALEEGGPKEEGRFYVWTWEEVSAILGERAFPFMEAYGFARNGNFADEATGRRNGANIPMAPPNEGWKPELNALLAARESRPRLGLDDKILVGQNGLMIAGLVRAGRIDLAERAAKALVKAISLDFLPRQIPSKALAEPVMDSCPGTPAFLEDYAGLAFGFALLGEALPEGPWRAHCSRLALEITDRFWDPSEAAFASASEQHESLFGPSRPVFDQPAPSPSALACRVLVRMGRSGIVERTVGALAGWMERAPTATEALHTALLEAVLPGIVIGPVRVWIDWEDMTSGDGAVVLNVADGWHLYGPTPPEEWMTPTSVVVSQPAKVDYPEGPYVGEIRIPFAVIASHMGLCEVTVSWQPCTDRECQTPGTATFAAQLG